MDRKLELLELPVIRARAKLAIRVNDNAASTGYVSFRTDRRGRMDEPMGHNLAHGPGVITYLFSLRWVVGFGLPPRDGRSHEDLRTSTPAKYGSGSGNNTGTLMEATPFDPK
jgi:hypothetical protein